jgi:hypothetical protein
MAKTALLVAALAAVSISGRPVSGQPLPQWDPLYTTCSNVPEESEVAGSWQGSAPRTPEFQGADVEIGLRSKFGVDAPMDIYSIVIGPQGQLAQGELRTIESDDWIYLNYPSDFIGGSTIAVGPYTIVWQADDGYIGCDGFMIQPIR